MGLLLQVWPAGLDMTRSSPPIYFFCPKPHLKSMFCKITKHFCHFCLFFLSCTPSPNSHPSPHISHFFAFFFFLFFFSVPLLPSSHLLSPSLEAKTASHSAKFPVPLPILKIKGIGGPVFPLFSVFGLNGAYLCMVGYGIVQYTNCFLPALPSAKAQSLHYPLPIASF